MDLACSVKMPNFLADSHILCHLIGASLGGVGEPHTYGTAVQKPPDIYTVYIYIRAPCPSGI